MGVKKYKKRDRELWRVNVRVKHPDGTWGRFKQAGIPTKEMATALERKVLAEAFEGRWFERPADFSLTVAEAWTNYAPVSKRHRSWQTEENISRVLIRHMGPQRVMDLTVKDVDQFRAKRFRETTRSKKAPAPATVDREVELLKRILNYAAECGDIPHNPVGKAKLLRKPNVRRSVVNEQDFVSLLAAVDVRIRPVLIVAYETGMRKEEVLDLHWNQVDLRDGVIRLAPQDTKTEAPRYIVMTDRIKEVIRSLPRAVSGWVFVNPKTGKRWQEIRSMFREACKNAGLKGVWFHDLRRSFVTNARKRGIPESVVMQMSGHKTREVFARYNIIDEQDLRVAARLLEDGRRRELGEEKLSEGTNGR